MSKVCSFHIRDGHKASAFKAKHFPHNAGRPRRTSTGDAMVTGSFEEMSAWLIDRCGTDNAMTIEYCSKQLGTVIKIDTAREWAMLYGEVCFKNPDIAFEFKLRWY